MHQGNFYFLKDNYSTLYTKAHKAESYLQMDAEVCAGLCRKALEKMVYWMFETDRALETIDEKTDNLNSLMHKPNFIRLIGHTLFSDINIVRRTGNQALHDSKKTINQKDAYTCVINLHAFAQWLASNYSNELYNEPFSVNKIGLEVNPDLKELATIPVAPENITKTEAGIEYHSPSEKLTRELYIDILLKEAGWVLNTENTKAEYLLRFSENGLDKADYVLFGNDGKALAVVEAKKTTVDGRDKGLRQAKRYADALEKEFSRRPILFTTNGFEHYIWDDLNYPYRPVQGFYSKEDLETLINRRLIEKPLKEQAVNTDIAGRAYQIQAIQRVKEELNKGNRDLLFIMATGSGKTRTAAALVDVLTKTNKVKRILFLADRNPLVSQAKKAFNDYLPQLTSVNLGKDKTSDQVRMVFSTYQTMINCIDSEYKDDRRLFTPGYFDLVIFDEVHRSIYKKYKAIFDYFDAIRLGLTATPKAETHKDTYELFHLETGVPTFGYELDVAVEEKYLKPPVSMEVPLKFPRMGIKYAELSEEDKLKYEENFASSEEDMPEEIDSTALNDWLFNEDTVNKVLKKLMDDGLKVNNGDTIGKTIIFAKRQSHANFIETCFNKMYPQHKGHFLQVITNASDKPEDAIDQFKQANKNPQIVVSVDMLDTGIDVPEILNLVFFKSVKSSAKYWQMVGRGTRLCPDVFGPGQDKKEFYIFDYCGNLEFFGHNPKGVEPGATFSLTQRVFLLKTQLAVCLEKFVTDDDLNDFRNSLLDELHQEILALDCDSFVNRPHLRSIDTFSDRNYWNHLTEEKVREIEKNILSLLVNADPDFDARRFDIISYSLIQANLNEDKSLPKLISIVKTTAINLLKQTTIPQVAQKKDLLLQISNDTWWLNTDIKGINHVREEIRAIIKFIEKEKQHVFYTNFTDELTGEIVFHEIIKPYIGLETYHNRVASFVRKNSNYLVINKIKNNQPISINELELIKTLLFEEDPEASSHLDEVLKGQDFSIFIRSIIGLDAKAANELFAEFINRPSITADQMTFMNTLINFLTINGTIDRNMLFERPFTDINQNGVSGVFENEDAIRLIKIIDGYNNHIGNIA